MGNNTKHGLSDSRIYRIWRGMRDRCKNTNNHKYKDYGGRGITVCQEWDSSFEKFYKWSINNGYHDNFSIDRKDNDGIYEPDNCQWSSSGEQANNKRNNCIVEVNGVVKTLPQWAKHTGIPIEILRSRYYRYGYRGQELLDYKTPRRIQKVIAIDPGEQGHNGICIAKCGVKQDDWNITYINAVDKHTLFRILETEFDKKINTFLIYETYRLYESKAKTQIGNEFETVQIIGVIKYICEKRGIPYIDSPTSNKAFFTDTRLKSMGLYIPIDHKRDAIRHFLYWLYFTSKLGNQKDLVGTRKGK